MRGVVLPLIFVAATFAVGAPVFHLEEDESIFPNPERGFYFYQNLENLDSSLSQICEERGITLVWGKISLASYREEKQLPEALIAKLQKGFEAAQKAGAKVIVRVEYGDKGPGGDYTTFEDPKPEIIEAHINQLAPLFAKNADRIAFFEAGFVGPWGEWHSTLIANDPELRRRIFFHLLKHTPHDRMVVLRYPALKQSIFETTEPLDKNRAYNGTDIARTGHHNDCFLSSADDVGTYNRAEQSMEEEMDYLAADTRYTLFGGESCRLHKRSERENALAELERFHASYLNTGYHPAVLKRWEKNGVMEIVKRRLGARFVVTAFDLPKQGHAGEKITIRITLANRGFASLYNSRPVTLVLIAPDGMRHRFPISTDPRLWKAGESTEIEAEILLPDKMTHGNYTWALHLPDASERLAGDPRFAIRFANRDAWDAETGENWLITQWPVE